VIVPIRSPEVLEAIEPDLPALRALSTKTAVSGYFLFALDESVRDTSTVCRMFAPAIGINEDPVNGSGHGPLAAYLLERGATAADSTRSGFWSRMGEHLGRAGRVWVQAMDDRKTVEVGGYVTPVFSATIELERAP
jgi:PhzF family phenazine biosynthesis protein